MPRRAGIWFGLSALLVVGGASVICHSWFAARPADVDMSRLTDGDYADEAIEGLSLTVEGTVVPSHSPGEFRLARPFSGRWVPREIRHVVVRLPQGSRVPTRGEDVRVTGAIQIRSLGSGGVEYLVHARIVRDLDELDSVETLAARLLVSPLALILFTPLFVPFWILWRNRGRGGGFPAGCCRHCGYDLRGTPGHCPECGCGLRQSNAFE